MLCNNAASGSKGSLQVRSLVVTFLLVSLPVLLWLLISNRLHEAASTSKSKVSRTGYSVTPLDLSAPPSTKALMVAGQLGGKLYPTEDHWTADGRRGKIFTAIHKIWNRKEARIIERSQAINLSFGHAIQAWNKHEWKKAAKLFRKHVKDYPDSPWASEAVLHLGCEARYNGRYREAEEDYRWILEKNRGKNSLGSKMLVNKARQRLGVLKLLQNNFQESEEQFRQLKMESPDWRHRTYASAWIRTLSGYKGREKAMLNCGVQALAYLLKNKGKECEADEVKKLRPHTSNGHNMEDLKSIAADYGYELAGLRLSPAELEEAPLPAILQLSGGRHGDRGHYWILEESEDNRVHLFDPQSGRRFQQSLQEFAREWNGYAMVFSKDVELPGIRLAQSEMENVYGGCCGAPRPVNDLGKPGPETPPQEPMSCGAPQWSVNMLNMNLFMTDTPFWYTPPVGPAVQFTLSYNSLSSIAINEPFGNKWQFNYGSYLVEDPGGTITLFMPDGKRDVFSPDGVGGYVRPSQVYNTLTQIAPNHFELRFPDDTVFVYNIPSGTASLQPFLIEIRDAYGQSLHFGYDTNVLLVTITDAQGQVSTLSYNTSGLCTRVDGPFGRFAIFQYDAGNNLTRITDMGGYSTSLSYDTNAYLTGLTDPSGSWTFYIEPSDANPLNSDKYPPPGDPMWENYRITVTNPEGGKEEYFYYGGCDPDYNICSGQSWHVNPEDYIPWQSAQVNNYDSRAPMALYFLDRYTSFEEEISKVLFPEGGNVQYQHDYNGNPTSVTDAHGNTVSYSYNTEGRVTSMTDAKGNVTNLTYAGNHIDPTGIQNGLGTFTLGYNSAHDVTSLTDRLGNTTTLTYNGYGQFASLTDPLNVVTLFLYDTNHRLQQITKGGRPQALFTYDSMNRVHAYTDETGLALLYSYNNLNKIIRIDYPDSRSVQYAYSACCPHLMDSVTDRSGRITQFHYDNMKRLTEVVNPEGGVIRSVYDENGNRTQLVDSNGHVTTFAYDLDNRLVAKTYDDGKGLSFTYDGAGLLTNRTNARGVQTTYSYDMNHNLLGINYSDTTPAVSFTYDNFDRIIQRIDGMGTSQYGYDAESRLLSRDGPWVNDTLTYQYDALGRRTNLSAQGGQAISYIYDTLGHLTDIQAGTNHYLYGYSGSSPLVQTLTRPNSSITTYQYDALNRLTQVSNADSLAQVINRYDYGYNIQDQRSSETVTNGNAISFSQNEQITYDYNPVNQLISSTNPARTFSHDADGNMTQGFTPAGDAFAAVYDAENRLQSIEYTDAGSVLHRTEYFYSGDGLLARKLEYRNGAFISEVRMIRDNFLAIQERDASNNVINEYLWGLDKGGGVSGLLTLTQGGQDYSYLYDGKGNVTALIDGTQAVAVSYTYDTFGNLMAQSGTLSQPFRFSTKRYDEQTGLSYYGYRYYSPALGRWMTRDPLGEAGGINLYGFVENNPISFWDPLGTSPPGAGPSGGGGTCGGGLMGPSRQASLARLINWLMGRTGYRAEMKYAVRQIGPNPNDVIRHNNPSTKFPGERILRFPAISF